MRISDLSSDVFSSDLVQDRRTGMKFTVADGYADFLREPAAHTVKIEGFFNIFPLVLNPLEDEKDLYPPSDVRLLRSPQIEYNRTKESLRQHRIADRKSTRLNSSH